MITFAGCTSILPAQNAGSLKVIEHKLNNGLTVWLNEDHSQPKVFGAVVVKAGAKDCPKTGIAHYFEHMMFKGTDKIGSLNYEAEKLLLDSIATKYDELAATRDTATRSRLQSEINQLNVKSSEYVIPNEFNRLISRYGGSGLNAGTSYDATIYYNSFSPQYMEQWAELNSERLLNPVFRLFQNELETVYEEKNMHGDFLGGQVRDILLERYFQPHPYAYPIIGTTENLKNPQLSEMRDFFEKYYVASNMGLILSGDFNSDEILPMLERTFGRIRSGEAPHNENQAPAAFHGKERIKVKFPIPFLKAMIFGFRGVPANHEDKIALNIAVNLLNNANGTGFLDRLMLDHRLMGAFAINESLNEAGILAIAVILKPVIQSYGSASKMVWKEINRVKEGDFSDDIFNSLKLEQKRQMASALENIDSRTQAMMSLYSQGKSWEDYLGTVKNIDSITKEDVVNIARKYFTNDYLYATKVTGKYPKDNLQKPNFAPVVPRNRDKISDYAKSLESLPVKAVKPRFIDFNHDVNCISLTPLVDLYTTQNKVNDIFSLTIAYGVGFLDMPVLQQLVTYLTYLGTDSLTFTQFRSRLQSLGSTMDFNVTADNFFVRISGFDKNFGETLVLCSDFLRHAKADDSKLKQVLDEDKVMRKAFFKTNENVSAALLEFVQYGNRSKYITDLSRSEVKSLKGEELINDFHRACKVACTIHYCGTLDDKTVESGIRQSLPLDEIAVASNTPLYREIKDYSKPTVFFYDMSDMAQSIVYGMVKGGPINSASERHASRLFSTYFGGGMSSLMFQEIREFRSYAYRASSAYQLPVKKMVGKAGCLVATLSTQCDKTTDAMDVLDSLIRKMPLKPERIAPACQDITNRIYNDYPAFRNLSEKVASLKQQGFDSDPGESTLKDVASMGIDSVQQFYDRNVSGRPVVYLVVGSKKNLDMKKLAAFGEIIIVKKNEIIR